MFYNWHASIWFNGFISTVTGSTTSWTISGTLPAGLAFNTSTGVISGTPSVAATATVYTITAFNGLLSSSTNISIACVKDDSGQGVKQ